jgi:Phospholipase A2-like domain
MLKVIVQFVEVKNSFRMIQLWLVLVIFLLLMELVKLVSFICLVRTGEYVTNGSFINLHKYSYCGPGTKYDQRVKEGYNGINELDSMCKLHDRFYNENQDTHSRYCLSS